MKIYLIICVLFVGCSTCNGGWSNADSYREAAFAGLVMIDWSQTLYGADHPQQYSEQNPVLGRHPSRSDVNIYMPVGMAAHAGVRCLWPPSWRTYWQWGTIGIEAVTDAHNAAIGVGIGR